MAVSKTQYSATTKQFTTIEGTLAEVVTQLQTDGVPLSAGQLGYDVGNSKWAFVHQGGV